MPRFNPITITMTDDNSNASVSKSYNLRIVLEEFLEDGQPPSETLVGPNEIEVAGIVGTKEEVVEKLSEVTEKFDGLVYDLRSTTINDIYGNKLTQAQFDHVNVLAGTSLADLAE